MVAPLFLISFFLDKINFTQKFNKTFQRPIGYSLGSKKISITISEAISGITFLAMGTLIGYLAITNRLFVHSEYQVNINIFLTKVLNSASAFIKVVPEYVWAALLIVAIVLIGRSFINQLKKEKHEEK